MSTEDTAAQRFGELIGYLGFSEPWSIENGEFALAQIHRKYAFALPDVASNTTPINTFGSRLSRLNNPCDFLTQVIELNCTTEEEKAELYAILTLALAGDAT